MKALLLLASILSAAAACGGSSKHPASANQPLPGEPSRDVAAAEPATPTEPADRSGAGPAEPAKLPIDVEEARPLVVRYGDLMRELNDELDRTPACPDAGQRVTAWSSANLAEIDQLEQSLGRLTTEQSKELVDELTAVGAESVRISGHVDRCAEDAEFAAAVQTAFQPQ